MVNIADQVTRTVTISCGDVDADEVARFYNLALLAALQGAIAGTLPLVKDFAMDEPCGTARAYALDLTEERFAVRLRLPERNGR